MTVLYRVEFWGDEPAQVRVGDKLKIAGEVTVKSIDGELVDVTAYGSSPEFIVGEVKIGLHSNRLSVTA